MEYNYKKLQNGSDIRGIAMNGVIGETPNLGTIETERLSKGFALWLSAKTKKPVYELKISVGRDPRLSGEALQQTMLNTFENCGITSLNCGIASTPAMFMTTVFPQYMCDAGIMITASHLPFNRNGFKFFDKHGGLNKKDIAEIINFAESDEELAKCRCSHPGYTSEITPLMEDYCKHLRNIIIEGVQSQSQPLNGLKIVVDAGNGSGGFYATKVLAPLGADISFSQFLEPDGNFPNHAPNPEDKAAMHSISQRVVEVGADFGLIFDTDVDRSAAVDNKGREIARNGIVAMAAALIAKENPGSTVVTDSITSRELTVFLEEKLVLNHLRFKRGYKNVINEAIRLNAQGINSPLAIETSGHAAFKENYFLDDGAYLATKIVIKAAKLAQEGKTLDSVIADLKEPLESVELRLPILCDDFASYGDKILDDLTYWADLRICAMRDESGEIIGVEDGKCQICHCGMSLVRPNFEGVRVDFDKENGDGWCLLRKSLHDPLMPLNIESNSEGGCRKIAVKLLNFLKFYSDLDVSTFEKILN